MFGILAGLGSPPTNDSDSGSDRMTATTYKRYEHPHCDNEDSQGQIDREISRHEDAIRELRSSRNALQLVNKLPPEIVASIFAFCATSKESHRGSFYNLSPHLLPVAWTRVTQVCRHWRAVALACPRLWSCPVFTSPQWAQEMLKRSKSAPLSIKVELSYMTPKMVEAVESAMTHIHRTTELRLAAADGVLDKLLDHQTEPAPFLESLSLSRIPRSSTESPHILPAAFLGGEAPRLRTLELDGYSIPKNSSLFNNLTRLKITKGGFWEGSSTTQVIDMLEKMPYLESLDLDRCLPALPEDLTVLSAPLRVVNFPHLSRISLSSQTLECANLLNHISFAPAATLQITCTGSATPQSDFTSLLPALVNWLNGPSGATDKQQAPLKWLRIMHTYQSLRFMGWNSGGTVTSIPPTSMIPGMDPVPRMELTFLSDHLWPDNGNMVVEVCKALPLSHLRVLDVLHTTFTAQKWVATFGSLQKLRTIHLRTEMVSQLVEALSTTTPKGGRRKNKAESNVLMFFPGLHNLRFDEADFGTLDEQVMEKFKDCLMLRSEQNAEIRSLRLRNCDHVFAHHVEELRELVVDVDWDHQERGYEDSEMDSCDDDEFGIGEYDEFWGFDGYDGYDSEDGYGYGFY